MQTALIDKVVEPTRDTQNGAAVEDPHRWTCFELHKSSIRATGEVSLG